MAYAVNDDRIPLLYDPLIWFRPTLVDEDITVEGSDDTYQPSNGEETRLDATGATCAADASLSSLQADQSHERSNAPSSSLEARPSLSRTEREHKSWIKSMFLKLSSYTSERVKASHRLFKTTQGDDCVVGKIWNENDERAYPMTMVLDPGSHYNLIDPDFALKIFPGGFRQVPEGSGGRFLDGSFLPLIGSVVAQWHAGNARFPYKVITTEFMVAERPLEYNLVIGKSEIRKIQLDSGERRPGIFGFIRPRDRVDPQTAKANQQHFQNDLDAERAIQAQERWAINRDTYANNQAQREFDNFVKRYEAAYGVTPNPEMRMAQWDTLFRSAREAYAQAYPCPPSPPGR